MLAYQNSWSWVGTATERPLERNIPWRSGAWHTAPGIALGRSSSWQAKTGIQAGGTHVGGHLDETLIMGEECVQGMIICLLSLSFKSILLCSALWCWNWVSANYSQRFFYQQTSFLILAIRGQRLGLKTWRRREESNFLFLGISIFTPVVALSSSSGISCHQGSLFQLPASFYTPRASLNMSYQRYHQKLYCELS